MRKQLLYPDRFRCRTCRRYLDFEVILRLYCSRKCASLPDLPANIEDRPRKCRVRIHGTWVAKAVYLTPDDAEASIGRQPQVWYLCEPPDGCGTYHVATKRTAATDADR